MKKIIHVIAGLENGGAEMMLYKLIKYRSKNKYDVEIVSMTDRGVFGSKIESEGIKVHTLNMRNGQPTLKSIIKLRNICKDADIIQSWMYHADLISLIVGKTMKNKKVVWGIHHSNLDKDKNKKLVLIVARINRYLSKFTYKIVCCSNFAKEVHIKFGFDKSKFEIIPNGFEVDKFYKVKGARCKLKEELTQIANTKNIVCHVARWDPLKDYNNLIRSIKIVSEKVDSVKYLLCGRYINDDNKELKDLIIKEGVEDMVILLGTRDDIPDIMSASDILILSSSGEAFPNVIGEAMACETPCISTDVGDCKYIIDRYGKVVKKQDSHELAIATITMLDKEESELKQIGKEARERIINMFSINKVVEQYEKIYEI